MVAIAKDLLSEFQTDADTRDKYDSRLVSAKTLAEILDTSERSIWRMRSSGKIPQPLKLGGFTKWRLTDIDQWIIEGCPAPI